MESIHKRIRESRLEKNMTLKELSEKTNLSVSFLSQVERGISSMTIVSLKNIAEALDVPMKDLFEVNERVSFINKKDNIIHARLEKSYVSYDMLSGKFDGRKLEAVMLTMEPNFNGQEERTHKGEEFYYVMKGTATFILDGAEYEICEGETIHYPSDILHKIDNRTDTELVMLTVVTPTIF